jgi:TolB-like protein/tetratricopeptide (TPR) repeat protein
MKRCPQCAREYGNAMMFCLDDGTELLYGPASMEERGTAILPSADVMTANLPANTPEIASNSIAVLPFTHMSSDEDNEYFCDGLAEELINALSKIDQLKVAARTSTFSFKGKDADIPEIARKLGVRTILEGSVRRSHDRLRITAQLINAADGYHLWSERYDREMKDIFDIQDEITLAVVEALKVRLLGASGSQLLRRQTANPEAYKAYLRGRYLRLTKNDHAGAMRAFEEAVRLDPSHAPSWVGVAEATILAAHYALVPALTACERARNALQRAEELQGDSAEGSYVEGFVAFTECNWSASENAFRKAIEWRPRLVYPPGSFGLTLSARQKFADAEPFFEKARELDPLSSFPYAISGFGRVIEGRLEDAAEFFEQAFAFGRENALALLGSTIANVVLGNFGAGISNAEDGVRVSRRAPFFLGILGWAFARAGRTDEARAILEELSDVPPETPLAIPQAWLLSELGEIDEAFELFRRAVEERHPFSYYSGLPTFDKFRDDPRFGDILSGIGLTI